MLFRSFAHGADWSIYYLEITMIAPFLVATGAWWVVTVFRERRWAGLAAARESVHLAPAGAAVAGALMAFGLVAYAPAPLAGARRGQRLIAGYHMSAHAAVKRLPGEKIVVFVRYARNHNPHQSLVFNEANLDRARVWWVYDRGADNARLLRSAPGRMPYLMDESRGWLGPLAAAPVADARHLRVYLAAEAALAIERATLAAPARAR